MPLACVVFRFAAGERYDGEGYGKPGTSARYRQGPWLSAPVPSSISGASTSGLAVLLALVL
jgi:hypothetical protein